MHADEDSNSITAPIHGARHGLQARAVFGQVITLHFKDDGPAGTGREIPIHTHVLDLPPNRRNTGGDVSLDLETPDHATADRSMAPLSGPSIDSMAPDSQGEMPGRDPHGTPRHATRAHVHRAHVVDGTGSNRKLLPFGAQPGHAGDEAAPMFVACCNEQPRFEEVHQHLTGRPAATAATLPELVDCTEASW